MPKPSFAALVLAVLICFALASPALAEEAVALVTVETASGAVGDEVDVAVRLDECIGVDSAQFDLNYDPAALAVVSVIPGDLFPVEFCVSNTDESGRVRVACACAEGLTQNGTLLTVRFAVLNETGSAVVLSNGIFTRINELYEQSESYIALENGGVVANGSPLPAPMVTPWVPATPIPTPSPTPEPTAEPTLSPETASAPPDMPDEEPHAASVGPIAYVVVGVLFLLLILLIALSIRRRSNQNKAPAKRQRDDE